MVQINFARKEINCKLVYYGPGMSGKTTNLEMVHKRTPEAHKGDLTSISTDGDRTLFFDFMPLDLGEIAGMKTKFHLYTVPGQVYYNSTRKLVLNGADGVIFIADSSRSKLQENRESLENLRENLAEMGKEYAKFPIVLQWNKRDIEDAMPVEELERELNPMRFPTVEGIAAKGEGVFQTLKLLSAKVLASINSTERIGLSGAALGGARGGSAPPTPMGNGPDSGRIRSPSPPSGTLRIERNEVGAATCEAAAVSGKREATAPAAPAPAAAPVKPAIAPAAQAKPALASSPLESVGGAGRAPTPDTPSSAGRLAASRPSSGPASSVVAANPPSRTVSQEPARVSTDSALIASMAKRATPQQRVQAPSSLSQGVRVIGALPRREPESSTSLKTFFTFGLIVAAAAGAATWFLLHR